MAQAMTDSKAKAILDFLARRAGHTCMSMREISLNGHNKHVPYLEDERIASPLWIDDMSKICSGIALNILTYDKAPSWRDVVEDIFSISGKDKKITDGFYQTVLSSSESIESIMIEMDLQNVGGNGA